MATKKEQVFNDVQVEVENKTEDKTEDIINEPNVREGLLVDNKIPHLGKTNGSTTIRVSAVFNCFSCLCLALNISMLSSVPCASYDLLDSQYDSDWGT